MSEIKIGERAPSFTLPDQNGKQVSLDAQLGKGAIVIFFYPKDGTPGCTTEVCTFRDSSVELAKAGAQVFGISSDSVESHRDFASKHKLEYSLLSDEGGKVRKAFGVPRGLLGLLDGRVTYVLDAEGIVRHRFEAMIRASKHVDEALTTVKRLAHAS